MSQFIMNKLRKLVLDPKLNVFSSNAGLSWPSNCKLLKYGDVSTPSKFSKLQLLNLIPLTPGNVPKVYGSSSPDNIPDMFQNSNVIPPPALLPKIFGLKLPSNLKPNVVAV